MKKKTMSFYILFVSMAIVFSTLESIIPKPFLFIKIGFANIITIFVLYKYGIKKSFFVLLLRILLASLILGTILTPSFILSFCGGMAGFFIMAVLYVLFHNHISALGISIAGAFANNLMQLAAAHMIFGFSKNIFSFIPYLALISIITGGIIGYLSDYLIKKISLTHQKTS